MRYLLALFLAAALFSQSSKTKTPSADWPMFNRDLAGTRYSPLNQINAGNVSQLKQVWSYRLQPANFRFATASGMDELTPIVVNGVMYISAQNRIMALDPESGKEAWTYE